MVGFVTETEGIAIVEDAGLEAAVTRKIAQSEEHGMVIIVDPEPGTVVPVGSTVTLTVGVDGDLAPVPDVVGMNVAAATATLVAANDFEPYVVYEETLIADNFGIVLEQYPATGEQATNAASIRLTVGAPYTATTEH